MSKEKTILFVDDSVIVQKTGKRILNSKGFKVIPAHEGQEALQLFYLYRNRIDLIVLDINMPKMDGLQFINALRNNKANSEALRKTPILVFSSQTSPKLLEKFVEAGANEFLDKSRVLKTPELFLERIYTLLGVQEQVEKYKKMKLERTLSPEVLDFQNFIKELVVLYLDTNDIPPTHIELMGSEIDELIRLTKDEAFYELIYDTPHLNDYFVSHCVNSCLLAIFFCTHFMNWEQKKVRDIAIGAILSDFGNLDKANPVLANPSEFSDEQFLHYKEHVKRSVELAKKLNLSNEAIDFIENHHEREDGKGFPAQKSGTQLDEIAKIAVIIETFDTLTFSRGINKKMMAEEALRQMASWEGQFSRGHLALFIKFVKQFEFKNQE